MARETGISAMTVKKSVKQDLKIISDMKPVRQSTGQKFRRIEGEVIPEVNLYFCLYLYLGGSLFESMANRS